VDRNNTEKPREDESWLTVSDWVTFLTSEKYGIISSVLNLAMLFVALIAIVLSTRTATTIQAIGNWVFSFGLLVFIYVRVFSPFEKRGRVAEKILKDVMFGTLKSEASIRKAWEKEFKLPKSR